MNEILIYILYLAPIAILGYAGSSFLFALLFRGFHPFIKSRPWVVEQILSEMRPLKQEEPVIYAFSSGRSGFVPALQAKYPSAKFVGFETDFYPYMVAKTQAFIRRTGLEIHMMPIHRVDVKRANLIYSHLYPEKMEGLGNKLRFECRSGTKVVSTGFHIPFLDPLKIISFIDRKSRWDILAKNQNIFQSKRKKSKKENKAFFYEI
jgi:hypothetical protein